MIIFIVFLVVLALLAQYFLSRNSLKHVKEDLYPEENVAEPGQVFYLNISLTNTGRWYLPFLRVSLFLPKELEPQDLSHCQKSRGESGSTVTYSTWLRPHQKMEFRLPVIIRERGRYVLSPLTVYGGDFLGLTEQVRRLDRFNEIVIAPREAPEQEIEAELGGFLGEVSVNRFLYEDPVLTVGFREYTGREPMKMISWTQSAKGHGLMVKNYDYTIEPRVSILVNTDLDAADRQDALEGCYSLARTVCRMLEEKRIPYDMSTNAATAGGWDNKDGLTVPQGLGAVHFGKVLELLGRATYNPALSRKSYLTRAIESRDSRSRILITAESGIPEREVLDRLRESSGGSLLVLTPRFPAGEEAEAV